MDATELPPTFQTALAIFDGLRRLGFEPDQIFFSYNPNGMHVVVRHDGKEWSLRAGDVDMSRDKWKVEWPKVATAVSNGEMTQESMDAVWQRFYPHRMKLVSDLLCAGIRVPNLEGLNG